jgi:hypothetical protein
MTLQYRLVPLRVREEEKMEMEIHSSTGQTNVHTEYIGYTHSSLVPSFARLGGPEGTGPGCCLGTHSGYVLTENSIL